MSCGQCRGEAPAFLARQLGSMAALAHNTTFRRCSHLDVSRQHSNDVFHAPNSRIVAALSKGNTSCCVDACKGAIHRTQQKNKNKKLSFLQPGVQSTEVLAIQTLSYLSNSFTLRRCPGEDLCEFASQIRRESESWSCLHQTCLVPNRLAYIFLIRLETPGTLMAQWVLSRVMSIEKSGPLKIFKYFNELQCVLQIFGKETSKKHFRVERLNFGWMPGRCYLG